MYCCLPKDHKEGELNGRPIHAAIDTPATHLSKFLSNSLKSILTHIPAHLKNTQEFVNFISTLDNVKGFCSSDVSNLYGSFPLNDREDGIPGLFTKATEFFSRHKAETNLVHLSDINFCVLLQLCLTSDVVMIKEQSYTQKSGLAMGNNLAPTLSIIYMSNLDQKILSQFNNELQLKRYVDDIFISWSSDNITPDTILNMANSLNPAIKFTLENPEQSRLPFLDTMITLHHNTGSYSSTLYAKPIHRQCINPWDSHGPSPKKKGILIGEIKRAISSSMDAASR